MTWRSAVVAGLAGVFLFGSAVLLRFAYPAWPIEVCLTLGAIGVALVIVYLRSGVRDRKDHLRAALSPELSKQLKGQRWISIVLASGLFGIFGLAGFAAIARQLFDAATFNVVMGGCAVALLFWCIVAGFGHWMRQRVLDQSEIDGKSRADLD